MTWSLNGCNPSDLPYTRQIAYLICWEQFGHIFTMTSRDLDLKGYLSSKMYSYIHVLSWQVIWWFCFTGNCVWQVVLFHGTWSVLQWNVAVHYTVMCILLEDDPYVTTVFSQEVDLVFRWSRIKGGLTIQVFSWYRWSYLISFVWYDNIGFVWYFWCEVLTN